MAQQRAQAAASARQAKAIKQADTDAKRLAAADAARDRGEVNLAVMLYLRLTVTGRKNEYGDTARQRLTDLASSGRRRLKALDAKLSRAAALEPVDKNATESENPLDPRTQGILQAFVELDSLARQYRRVPKAGRVIRATVRKRHAEPRFAAVVNEPQAESLWKLAREYDRKGQVCCAVQVYEQAVKMSPAPSAIQAGQRLAVLKKDPRNIKAAKLCAELQRCHDTFRRAERLVKLRPDKAKALFGQVLARAPSDSEIYQAARMQIAELTSG
ncbi:MAG: hypothetical protein IID44_22965 [Planctomycetes bacterium]|nr:hypothetical protein [Planctomycetota bacterium]